MSLNLVRGPRLRQEKLIRSITDEGVGSIRVFEQMISRTNLIFPDAQEFPDSGKRQRASPWRSNHPLVMGTERRVRKL